MKILIVAPLAHPEQLTSGSHFPPSQAQFFWERSLRKAGHEVDAFIRNTPALVGMRLRRSERFTGNKLATVFTALSQRFPRWQPDYHARNRRLLEKVRAWRPDVILLTGDNRVIFTETLAEIKRRYGCKIVYLSGVSPIVFSTPNERAAAPLYDLVLVNDYYHGVQWLELGAARMEALPIVACDPEFHHPYAVEVQAAVGFVGTLLPDHLYSTRVTALEAVKDLGLGVWSIHALPASLQDCYRGPALGEAMLRAVCASKIQVNPHGNFMRWGGNMRLFEAAACGVFQITDDRPGIPTWFTVGEQIVTFRDPAHLRDLVRHYLRADDERAQIAAAAREHVYAHHTYDHRMQALVELVAALP